MPFVHRPLQPASLVTTADIAYGLGSEWDYVGDLRCAGALRQLQQNVRPCGANHQRVKIPHQEISVCLDS
jgi:hypothetical protein